MTPGLTVVIPVGPMAHHADRLAACLQSVRGQGEQPDHILLIDDMHGLPGKTEPFAPDSRLQRFTSGLYRGCLVWRAPWRLGVPGAFNAGVALAPTPLAFLLGADDELAPQCLQWAHQTYRREAARRPGLADLSYYWVSVEYTDTGEPQAEPCNAALVTRAHWALTGGFPPETASGACDAAFISTMLARPNGEAGYLVPVVSPWPLYRYHRSTTSDTAGRAPWQGVILATRDILTAGWERPRWGALMSRD